MREALQVFQKDVRHLWPRIVLVLAVTILLGWMECQAFALFGPVRNLWLLSAAFLAVSVIQQEALPGHQQYWLTRPYHRGHLFLVKALFLAVFTGLPVLMIEAISLWVNRVSPWQHLPLLLLTTVIFAGASGLIVAALASVTENLVQFLWGFLPSVGAVILCLVLAGRSEEAGGWGSLEWSRSAVLGGVGMAAACTVLYLQYSRRKTVVSRVLLGAAILIAAVGPFLGSWHAAWAIESKLSKRQLDASAALLVLDPAGRPALGFADALYSPGAEQAGINLPILMTGIPAGTEVVCERIAARIEAPDGRSWASAWTRKGGLYRTTPLVDPYVIPGDGPYWEYVNLDDGFYQSVKDTPVHLHTSVALTLLGERQTAPLATRDRNEYYSADGMCRVDPGPFAKLMVSCAWLGHAPARSYVTAVSIRNGQTFASLISAGSGDPFPLNGSVWERDSTLFSPPPATHEMDLETWQAVAYFDRDLDIPQIRLADYAVRRITDMP
jgi:hypothetical protein